jgi:hypothetical protein
LRPILPGWLFDSEGCVTFKFLGSTSVKVTNPEKLPTWQLSVLEYALTLADGKVVTIAGETVPQPYAGLIRDGKIKEIVVTLKS